MQGCVTSCLLGLTAANFQPGTRGSLGQMEALRVATAAIDATPARLMSVWVGATP